MVETLKRKVMMEEIWQRLGVAYPIHRAGWKLESDKWNVSVKRLVAKRGTMHSRAGDKR